MKFHDIAAALDRCRSWEDARRSLTVARNISLNVTIARECQTIISLPASFIIPAILARLAELRAEMIVLGITDIPPDDPTPPVPAAWAADHIHPRPEGDECGLTAVISHLDQVDYSCKVCGHCPTVTEGQPVECGREFMLANPRPAPEPEMPF
jgi:hypothetical protein